MSVLFSSEMSAQPPLKWIVAYLLTRIISATVFSGVSGQLDKSIVNGIEIKALAFEVSKNIVTNHCITSENSTAHNFITLRKVSTSLFLKETSKRKLLF